MAKKSLIKSDYIWIGFRYFDDGPVAEFKDGQGDTQRFNKSSLIERIKNLKEGGVDCTPEQKALKALEAL